MAMYRFPAHRRVDIDEYAATDNQKDTARNDIIDVPSRNIFPAYTIHRPDATRLTRCGDDTSLSRRTDILIGDTDSGEDV
mgnify:CR=1 FL=1